MILSNSVLKLLAGYMNVLREERFASPTKSPLPTIKNAEGIPNAKAAVAGRYNGIPM